MALVGDESRVFASLREAGAPIVAAVAFSLYTQAKHEWIRDFEQRERRRPTDEEIAGFVGSYGVVTLEALLSQGERVFEDAAIESVEIARPAIVAEALRGGFWRAVWPSFVATVAFSLALALVAFSAALLGFGLPVAISVARS